MLSIEELRKLASLARIGVQDQELENLRGQLQRILEFVGEVQKADLSGAGEASVPAHHNVFREDGRPHEPGQFTDDIMRNVPGKERGYVRVKKILEK